MNLVIESYFSGVNADDFIEALFSDEFVARSTELSNEQREVVEQKTLDDGSIFVRTKVVATVSLPGPLNKLVPGSQMTYYELVTFDANRRSAKFEATGEKGDKRLHVFGSVTISDRPGGVQRGFGAR